MHTTPSKDISSAKSITERLMSVNESSKSNSLKRNSGVTTIKFNRNKIDSDEFLQKQN